MQIFEDHPQFKIVHEENGQQVDLNRISEMLKAEHHSWIKRFSKEIKGRKPELIGLFA